MWDSTGTSMGESSRGSGAGGERAALRVAFVSQFVYPHDEEVRIRRLAAPFDSHGWRCAVFSRGQPGIPDEDAWMGAGAPLAGGELWPVRRDRRRAPAVESVM